jgi:hypothetical protein
MRRPVARSLAPVPLAGVVAAAALLAGGCGQASVSGGSTAKTTAATPAATGTRATGAATASVQAPPPPRPVSSTPAVTLPSHVGREWRVVATVRGQPAAWIAAFGGATLLHFDQGLVRLALHAGTSEPGGGGWRNGSSIGPHEVHRVLAGFNGGFKLTYGHVGFLLGGRTAAPLHSGLGSIVTYEDGSTQIGSWHEGVPAAGKPIASVRQNLHLLVDHGVAAANTESCVSACWGETLGGGTSVARSALGIDAAGQLVWAAGISLTPGQLARALTAAGVQRAVELDINPFWVAGYLYAHHSSGPTALPVVPGQHGIAGQLLEPDGRDFFTVLAR